MFGLSGFLREHYTASRESAATIATYLAIDRPPRRASARARPSARPRATRRPRPGEKKAKPKSDAAKSEKPGKAAKPVETKTSEPKPSEPTTEPKSDEAKPKEPKPKDAKSRQPSRPPNRTSRRSPRLTHLRSIAPQPQSAEQDQPTHRQAVEPGWRAACRGHRSLARGRPTRPQSPPGSSPRRRRVWAHALTAIRPRRRLFFFLGGLGGLLLAVLRPQPRLRGRLIAFAQRLGRFRLEEGFRGLPARRPLLPRPPRAGP